MRICSLGDTATAPAPYSREALRQCGVDPEAINLATGVPNWMYPGMLPPEVLRRCQEMWNAPVILPYGEEGPTVIINPDGEIGRPEDTIAQEAIDAAATTGGVINVNAETVPTAAVPVLTTATPIATPGNGPEPSQPWWLWAIAGLGAALLLRR